MLKYDHQKTVKDLLPHLCHRDTQLSWKKRCLYTKRVDKSVMEIRVYQQNSVEGLGAVQLSSITYDHITGKITQINHRGEYHYQPG